VVKQKLAIFDIDGTLYDTNAVNYAAYAQAMREYGYTLNYDYYCQKCNGRHYKMFFPEIGIRLEDYTSIHERKKALYVRYINKARENLHLFNIIDAIKDEYYLAAVTTASRKNCEDILQGFKRIALFDLVLTHEDINKVKPDPEGFLKAMDYFAICKENTMIFEDSDEGMAAAKATGAAVFVVKKF